MSTFDVRLWSDEPSDVDLLAFDAIAATVADAVMEDDLDPLALGLSGPWGSGKTTVLGLIEGDLDARSDRSAGNVILVVRTEPWRYDPAVGAKESLIAEVLDALTAELERDKTPGNKALELAKRLAKRVDWAKALKLAAQTSLTLQLPGLESLTDLIRDDPAEPGEEGESRGLAAFRSEFERLMKSDELKHVRRVVVLVDDLDRCLPDTVVETLEAIRLFLSVKGMSFVLAADEERVADAIRTRLPETAQRSESSDPYALPMEEPSKLYLHKIVQTTVPLPALGGFDTESYLLLLQLQNRASGAVTRLQLDGFIAECVRLRMSGGLDDLQAPDGLGVQDELAFAARMTPILYEKFRGNPRRIKRFLNDINVRRTIAGRRGIELDLDVIAKLMVLEVLLEKDFTHVLGWLRSGQLRDRMIELEARAGQSTDQAHPPTADAEDADPAKPTSAEPASADLFTDDIIRWAKLPPALAERDLSPYLHLAASFSGDLLVDQDLPSRLRDIAANLASSAALDRRTVTDEALRALGVSDVELLIPHLGRRARDRRTEQRAAVNGIARLAEFHPSVAPLALKAFRGIPAAELDVASVLRLKTLNVPGLDALLDELKTQMPEGNAKRALLAQSGPR